MRKLILLLLLLTVSITASAQLTKDSLQAIAKEHFENIYVQKNFKDPYSYELKKIWSEPRTEGDLMKEDIAGRESFLDMPGVNKKMRTQIGEVIKNKKSLLQNTSAEQLSKVGAYDVYFDTYGANSYGNKILGRYKVRINNTGQILGEVRERKD